MVKHIQDFTFYLTPGTWHQRVTPHSWVQIQILGVGVLHAVHQQDSFDICWWWH